MPITSLKARFDGLLTDESGAMHINLVISHRDRYKVHQAVQEIKKRDKPLKLVLDWFRSKRSLDQNAMLWALLTELSLHYNAGRTGGISPEKLYMQALEQFGVASFVIVPVGEQEDALKRAWKITKRIDIRLMPDKDGHVIEWAVCKCCLGSSQYDTKEMTNLINGVLDWCSKAGIGTLEYQSLVEEWNNEKRVAG